MYGCVCVFGTLKIEIMRYEKGNKEENMLNLKKIRLYQLGCNEVFAIKGTELKCSHKEQLNLKFLISFQDT